MLPAVTRFGNAQGHLIRSELQSHFLPGHLAAELLKRRSLRRDTWRRWALLCGQSGQRSRV